MILCVRGYCLAHDEWLIRKLCRYVGYHDANNMLNFGGDPATQLNVTKRFKKILRCFTGTVHHSCDTATGFAAVATRPRWSMDRRWPYQPKHSPSLTGIQDRKLIRSVVMHNLYYYCKQAWK